MSKASILVTGAAGFIGARLVERLNSQTVDIVSVDKASYFIDRKEHNGLDFGTIVDRNDLFKWLSESKKKLKAIVHLGACTDTSMSDQNYLDRMNLNYSAHLWSYCARHNIPFVYASSAATYGAGELGYKDDEAKMNLLNPLNLYGRSKLDFDLWALRQEKMGNHPPNWAGFKFFNVYGFGESHKNSMSSVVLGAFNQILNTSQVRLFKSHKEGISHGDQMRDFVYVEDVVDVLLFALKKPLERGIYNLGSGSARTFNDLAKATFHALKISPNIIFVDTPEKYRKHYQYFTEADMTKLKSTGYTQTFTSLEEGVQRYVNRLIEFNHIKLRN